MAPLIGITTYPRDENGRVNLPVAYSDAVRRAGGIPLLIPPGEPRQDELLAVLDAIIFSGGGDIEPTRYSDGQHALVYSVNPERDQFEIDLVRRSLDAEKPVLCICRGLQVLNVALGGSLIQHIPDVVPDAVEHRLPPREPSRHAVDLDPESRLVAIMGQGRVTTASWHHQAIDRLAEGLRVVGWASDDVIEAVEVAGKPQVMAVQWHPELSAAEDAAQQALFDNLVKLGSRAG
ncbi:MAG: gamma-glutamyl-gamma-aminobutyrate hydrolase family protein [Chloroflexi bacterium]|nr:gamma-glutamyl-gamma-aminobutyrate hydrolase family protein [Chloroflexota bacterium]